ncbi:MAG: sulfotransferase, partial [Planctomycetota bacterium]
MPAELDGWMLRHRPGRSLARLVAYTLFEGRPVTTRGQWINPLVFAQLGLWKRLPPLATVRAPIFVLGSGRSGTTVLARLLARHREVALLNEPKALWHAAFPGQDVIGSYAREPGKLLLDERDATSDSARALRRLYAACARLTASARIVDKYPEMLLRVPFLRALFPDAIFLVAERDGLATALSVARWSQRFGRTVRGARHDWWGVDDRKWRALCSEALPREPDLAPRRAELAALSDDRARAALEWLLNRRESARLAAARTPNLHTVRLEDFRRAPEEVLGRVLAVCGLAPDAELLAQARA